MSREIVNLYSSFSTFTLDERFSEPIREYYYNLRSLIKYWELTKDLVSKTIHENKEFFSDNLNKEFDIEDLGKFDVNSDLEVFDGDEIEHDKSTIPKIQKNLILSNCIILVEKLLRDVCKEINDNYELNDKGSYIQKYYHVIKTFTSIKINKKYLKDFESFGHLRNSYMHQFDLEQVPQKSKEYINELTSKFVSIDKDITNIHIDLLLKILCDFGNDFQIAYWKDFDKRIK